jgi:dTDP-4-dehydrorhamnose 3,5-epimerase
MIFQQTTVAGVLVVRQERREDERGFFARTFCIEEFRRQGVSFDVVQCNTSCSRLRGTLRGMHYQKAPHAEAKLVACTRGRIHDVALDLRPNSPTFRKNIGHVLDPREGAMLYIPEGVAHGFLTLADDTEVAYWMSAPYHAESASGVRYNDPAFGIAWPEPVRTISDRDRAYPDFVVARTT